MTSRKPPVVGTFIDEDQRHLAEAIERDGYDPGANLLTPERLAAFQAGARGYVTKASAPDTLVEAVHRVAAGERYIGPDMAQTIALQSIGGDEGVFDTLSAREFEVMRLILAGASLSEIAAQLRLSYKTVANQQSLIRQKLGVQTQLQLMQLAARHGVGRP